VLAKIAFEYRFDGFRGEGGDVYRGTAQITVGQEIIYLTEQFSLGDPKVYCEPQFSSEAEELLWDWWPWRPHEAADNFCFSFTAGGVFQPTHARCIQHNVTTPTKGRSMNCYGENEYPLPFDSSRLEFTLNAYTCLQPDRFTDPHISYGFLKSSLIYILFCKIDLYLCVLGGLCQPPRLPTRVGAGGKEIFRLRQTILTGPERESPRWQIRDRFASAECYIMLIVIIDIPRVIRHGLTQIYTVWELFNAKNT
jgi:hypothetical protein